MSSMFTLKYSSKLHMIMLLMVVSQIRDVLTHDKLPVDQTDAPSIQYNDYTPNFSNARIFYLSADGYLDTQLSKFKQEGGACYQAYDEPKWNRFHYQATFSPKFLVVAKILQMKYIYEEFDCTNGISDVLQMFYSLYNDDTESLKDIQEFLDEFSYTHSSSIASAQNFLENTECQLFELTSALKKHSHKNLLGENQKKIMINNIADEFCEGDQNSVDSYLTIVNAADYMIIIGGFIAEYDEQRYGHESMKLLCEIFDTVVKDASIHAYEQISKEFRKIAKGWIKWAGINNYRLESAPKSCHFANFSDDNLLYQMQISNTDHDTIEWIRNFDIFAQTTKKSDEPVQKLKQYLSKTN